MAIWKRPISLDAVTTLSRGTAAAWLGIEFLEIGDDFITARVPVDHRTRQPYGVLHGGVSVLLAETLGSVGADFCTDVGVTILGLDINANHLKATTHGWVTGTARPVHLGRSTQVWQIDLRQESGALVCVARLTVVVLAPKPTPPTRSETT